MLADSLAGAAFGIVTADSADGVASTLMRRFLSGPVVRGTA
jgi:hypothetical protein